MLESRNIKTFGDAVKYVKRLYSALGIECWAVYFTEVGRYTDWPVALHSENSEKKAYPGLKFQTNTCLIVSDTIELFIDKEEFLFVI